jgi:hypothetical protein
VSGTGFIVLSERGTKHAGREDKYFNAPRLSWAVSRKIHPHPEHAVYLWLRLQNFSVIEESLCRSYLGNQSMVILVTGVSLSNFVL